jgi:hypothetical protein
VLERYLIIFWDEFSMTLVLQWHFVSLQSLYLVNVINYLCLVEPSYLIATSHVHWSMGSPGLVWGDGEQAALLFGPGQLPRLGVAFANAQQSSRSGSLSFSFQ